MERSGFWTTTLNMCKRSLARLPLISKHFIVVSIDDASEVLSGCPPTVHLLHQPYINQQGAGSGEVGGVAGMTVWKVAD